jgi:predicted nucleic acid-binding protein
VIVADTNLIAYYVIRGARTTAAEGCRMRDSEWIAPILWRSELRNVLVTTLNAGLISLAQAKTAFDGAATLVNDAFIEARVGEVFQTAALSRISSYDAEFVVLARNRGIRLVTADQKLATRCPDVCVSIEDFEAGR